MKNIKFGRNETNKPTPKSVSFFLDITCVVASVVSGFVIAVKFIPSNISDIIASILTLLIIPLAQGLKPYFSVVTNKTKVDIEDVGEMEADPKP